MTQTVLTWSKTAPHSGMGWLFEFWNIFAVLAHMSRANYCNDYFKCTVHFSFASLFGRLLGQTCSDGLLGGKMWVPHTVVTPVKFLKCTRECWSQRYPTMHTGHAVTQHTSQTVSFDSHSTATLLAKSTILWEEGLWIYLCKLTKTEGTTERCLSKQLTGCCCYRPVFTRSSGKKLIVLFTKNLERDLHHTSSSLSGWFYSRASTERDTQSLCLLTSLRRAQMGRKAAEHVTQVCLSVCFMAWMLDQLQCP